MLNIAIVEDNSNHAGLLGSYISDWVKDLHIKKLRSHNKLHSFFIQKAPTRFELVIEVLQTFALPLGHGAISNNSIYNYEGSKILFLLH